jgi:hypothetical protein
LGPVIAAATPSVKIIVGAIGLSASAVDYLKTTYIMYKETGLTPCIALRLILDVIGMVTSAALLFEGAVARTSPVGQSAPIPEVPDQPEPGTIYSAKKPNKPGALITEATLSKQGTSSQVGDFTGLEGATVEEIISRIPADWTYETPQGQPPGINFTSTDKNFQIRIHAENPNAPVGSNSWTGWIVRVGEKMPSHPWADSFGFVYFDNFGILGQNYSGSTHIPIFGNPVLGP